MTLVAPLFTHASAQGKAAELKAAVLLMGMGYEVAVPLADNGVDLVVNYRIRVQVKSSGVKLREVSPGQTYPLCVWTKIKPADADIYLLHAYYEGHDRWFVCPSSLFGDVVKTTISMVLDGVDRGGWGRSARIREFENAWEIFDEPG